MSLGFFTDMSTYELPIIQGIEYDPEVPAIDEEQIEMFLMTDEDEDETQVVRELFELFMKESDSRLPMLREHCADNNQPGVRKILHFIAGSAANIGLLRLSTYYRAIEYAIEGGSVGPFDAESAERIIQHYEQGCEDYRAKLKL